MRDADFAALFRRVEAAEDIATRGLGMAAALAERLLALDRRVCQIEAATEPRAVPSPENPGATSQGEDIMASPERLAQRENVKPTNDPHAYEIPG